MSTTPDRETTRSGQAMRNYEQLAAMIYETLLRHAKDDRKISEDTVLSSDLGLDSAQVMDLILDLEERFDISIPLNILPDVHTVRDLTLQIEKLMNSRQ
jgi:acyl carrier protein